jgi:hypothetical protein
MQPLLPYDIAEQSAGTKQQSLTWWWPEIWHMIKIWILTPRQVYFEKKKILKFLIQLFGDNDDWFTNIIWVFQTPLAWIHFSSMFIVI